MPKDYHREIIELSASILTGVTETRTSEIIPWPFTLRDLAIYVSAPLITDFTFRIGFTRGESEAIASDPLFEDFYSPRSSKEANRYPDQVIFLHPGISYLRLGLRLKAEGINATGVEHSFWMLAIIEETKSAPE